MSTKMRTLICHLNRKIVNDKKDLSYKGPVTIAIIIRSHTTFQKFIDEMYQVTGYERRYSRLAVTCRYPIQKKEIALPIMDQKTVDIALVVVAPPGNNLEVYIISPTEENPPHVDWYPTK